MASSAATPIASHVTCARVDGGATRCGTGAPNAGADAGANGGPKAAPAAFGGVSPGVVGAWAASARGAGSNRRRGRDSGGWARDGTRENGPGAGVGPSGTRRDRRPAGWDRRHRMRVGGRARLDVGRRFAVERPRQELARHPGRQRVLHRTGAAARSAACPAGRAPAAAARRRGAAPRRARSGRGRAWRRNSAPRGCAWPGCRRPARALWARAASRPTDGESSPSDRRRRPERARSASARPPPAAGPASWASASSRASANAAARSARSRADRSRRLEPTPGWPRPPDRRSATAGRTPPASTARRDRSVRARGPPGRGRRGALQRLDDRASPTDGAGALPTRSSRPRPAARRATARRRRPIKQSAMGRPGWLSHGPGYHQR